jgi:hypothetical protein
MKTTKRHLWLLLSLSLFLSYVIPSTGLPADPTPEWVTYRNERYGYQLEYPTLFWEVIEAQARTGEATWSAKILEEGEVQKVTFVEQDARMGFAELQVRVLKRNRGQDLEGFVGKYEVTDIHGDSLIQATQDTTLGGIPAEELTVWLFDHIGTQVIAVHGEYIYLLSFAKENPNHPEHERHKGIYRRMVASFKFLP